jgi:hypothetical protein
MTESKIQKALGASYSIKLKSANEHGPLGWLHMAHDVAEIQRRHQQMRDTLQKLGWRRVDRTNQGICEELWLSPDDGVGQDYSAKASVSKRLELAYKQAMKNVTKNK